MGMNVSYDFQSGSVKFDYGESYNLESLRRYGVNYHPHILKDYFIKCVRSQGRAVFTYDFDGFFHQIDIPFLRQYKQYLASCYDDQVRPVAGISINAGCLDALYLATKRQFIVDEHEYKLLQGKLGRTDGRGVQYPLMVFSGVADMHGFPYSDIMEEAQLESMEHLLSILDEFKIKIKEAIADKPNRIYTKTKLVLNDLRSKYEKYVDLGDIGM